MKNSKTFKRLLCLALAVLCLASLAACSKNDGSGDGTSVAGGTTAPVAETTEAYEALPVMNYDKYEFKILTRPTTWSYDALTVEEQGKNVLDDIVYSRQNIVQDRLNITFSEVNSQNISKDIATAVSTQTHLYDVCQLPTGTALQSFLRGEVVDINEVDGINLENPWWAKNFNDTVNIGTKRYVIFGDGHLNYYSGFYIYAFNKQLISENNLESPYDCVTAGTWTYEKMYSMMKIAAKDYNADGVYDVSTDVLGFTGHVNHLRNLMISSGETLTHNDDSGYPVYEGLSERYINVYTDFLNKFVIDPTVAIAGVRPNRYEGFSSGAASDNYAAVFNEGRALFQATATYSVQSVRNLDFEYA